jgi:hypothetical protein
MLLPGLEKGKFTTSRSSHRCGGLALRKACSCAGMSLPVGFGGKNKCLSSSGRRSFLSKKSTHKEGNSQQNKNFTHQGVDQSLIYKVNNQK